MSDLDDLGKRLNSLSGDAGDVAFAIVEGLADVWVDESKRKAPVDTGQLRARTAVRSVRSAGVRAEAVVVSDVPYAGYQEYGTRYQAPRPYFRDGRDAAAREADRLGGRIESDLRRVLTSGGSWNPRSLF